MIIETSRLVMHAADEQALKVMKVHQYNNGQEVTNHVKELAVDASLLGWGSWLVFLKSDEALIGDAGFKGKPNSRKEVEVGYGFLEAYWGMGYATEAVGGLIDWAFQTSTVEKVIAETDYDNAASIRVLEKNQMKKIHEAAGMVYWELTER